MARPSHQSRLNASSVVMDGLLYSEADEQDDAAIRQFLADTPMPGWITLTMQRDPSYFIGARVSGDAHQSVIARILDSNDVVGLFNRSVYQAYVNGEVRSLGYLGGLRVAPAYRHKIRRLRQGFEALRVLVDDPKQTPFYLTSIVQENHAARRILAANLPGMPRYHPCGEICTLTVSPTTRMSRVDRDITVTAACVADLPEIAACLQRNYSRYQFAPYWDLATLQDQERCRNLRASDFLIVRDGTRVIGCVAMWDQRTYKQIVVRGYHPWLRRTRSILNLFSLVTGLPKLPAVGGALKQIYFSHLAVDDDNSDIARAMIAEGLSQARARGVSVMNLGLAINHKMYRTIREQMRAREYRSELYLVSLANSGSQSMLDDRTPHVEVAIL